MPDASVALRKKVIKGSGWAILSKIAYMASAFLSVPVVLGYLGVERMGLWRLAVSILSVITLINAGLIPHLKTRMAEAFSVGDEERFREYCSTGLLIGSIVLSAGLVAALPISLVDWVGLMKVVDPVARQETVPLVAVLAVILFAQVGTGFVPAIYDARLRLSKPRIYELAGSLAGFLGLIAGVAEKVSLPWLAALYSGPTLFFRVVMAHELFLADRSLFRPRWKAASRITKELVKPGLLAVGVQGTSVLLSVAPNVMIARLLSLSDVARFSVCYQLASLPLIVLAAVMPVFWPAFTMTWRSGAHKRVADWLLAMCGGTLALCLMFATGLRFVGPWVVRLWTKGAIDPSGDLLLLLGVFATVQGLLYWISTFMWSLSELWIQFWTQAVGTLVLVGSGVILATSFGLNGMALAMAVSLALAVLAPMSLWAWRLIDGRVKPAADRYAGAAPAVETLPAVDLRA